MCRRNLILQQCLEEKGPDQLHPDGHTGHDLDPMDGYTISCEASHHIIRIKYSALKSDIVKCFLASPKSREGGRALRPTFVSTWVPSITAADEKEAMVADGTERGVVVKNHGMPAPLCLPCACLPLDNLKRHSAR